MSEPGPVGKRALCDILTMMTEQDLFDLAEYCRLVYSHGYGTVTIHFVNGHFDAITPAPTVRRRKHRDLVNPFPHGEVL